jgi:hypothetical protein
MGEGSMQLLLRQDVVSIRHHGNMTRVKRKEERGKKGGDKSFPQIHGIIKDLTCLLGSPVKNDTFPCERHG